MLTIYAIPVSLYCAKLRILLRHKSLEWEELSPPGGYGSDEYKKIVPSGNLPALIDKDLLLADSEAIAEYLNEKYPEPAMLPDDLTGRAKIRERARFHDTRLEPALRQLFSLIPKAARDDARLRAGGEVLSRHLKTLARLLETAPLSRDALWLGDIGFAISVEWIAALEQAIGLPVNWPDAIRTYREDLRRHAAVDAELSEYLPRLLGYLAKATE
ncbi:glutathione S-transferase family protein [Pseudohalocynthiibacter aestuariivivens]|jgi:glutathione S-transferase|uniref:Glutathione S-transferase family protein n=1 Tax=Pseudohalocynthiibacter aestuariivivens TaxID=1591409 RepID=A0ABV5JD48_9RHOB|nr:MULTISPECIES: glutathione S-transferase family protein [Pseudohalocynthiibacter]MBS9715801.1 glutathione S-transferase family protein [Pseudohalocynthiibacter aestuariivivens]MCK0101414.1 glutathione S-transferase family protein [Pseudohalocynthiibacter sp. F2068]